MAKLTNYQKVERRNARAWSKSVVEAIHHATDGRDEFRGWDSATWAEAAYKWARSLSQSSVLRASGIEGFMTVVEQAVAAMEEAKQEILRLREENAELLHALKLVRSWYLEDMSTLPMFKYVNLTIAKSEANQ